ncbi:phage distal tail protein, Rcc01695 family [Polymorphobacter sp.]|uniref:phage distal tail protein, Rcc01695 family n=1 Tax=Polymorphobacter sp. TaxID=1909290 RepID=UPI003F6F7FF7
MRHWLAKAGDGQRRRWVKRFDPRFWTVDFPRPMMAAVTSVGADGLAVDAEFLRRGDLAGLIWESEDRWSHPLLALETARDYRGVRLSFRVQLSGDVVLLDAVNGPVLTIEGRDAAGVGRAWYVRLWNYASGTPADARVVLDFDALDGGFVLPGEADRVWAGDIDRMFISLVATGYDGSDAPLPAVAAGRMLLGEIVCEGPGSVIAAGDAFVPPHGLHIASGYDDSYNQTPERLVEAMLALGYRGSLVHYVGMSHFPALGWDAGAGAYLPVAEAPVCGPALAWHADFVARAVALGFSPILSLSFELLDQHCPDAWAQRNGDGARGLTGYVPPSALLSPAAPAAMAWLQAVAAVFMGLAVTAGAAPRFQIGEPWWWVGPDGKPCLYDPATVALYLAETGLVAPAIGDVRAVTTAAQRDFLDWCGGLLGRATLALRDAARTAAAECESLLLFYAPQVLDSAAPELIRANLPLAWAAPAFEVLQLEDYEFVTGNDFGGQRRARDVVAARLGYPLAAQHYFSGFALADGDWAAIAGAAEAARGRGVAETFIWAWPQVARAGFTVFAVGEDGEEAPVAFHDVLFPLQLGFGAAGGPEFSTQVVVTASGHEQRNSQWSDARQYYDAGLGVRSEADLSLLIAFFRARRGQAYGFRFNDPLDNSSGLPGQPVSPTDQPLGAGDGGRTRFALTKRYGEDEDAQLRRISRPLAETVVVAVDGATMAGGWTVGEGGFVDFDEPPAAGALVTAGYRFDVPVRFAVDRIDVSIAGWRAGELPSVPLVEVREG